MKLFTPLSITATIVLCCLGPTNAQKSWEDAYSEAQVLVSKMTLEDKIKITRGDGFTNGKCVGNTYSTENFPSLCLQDGPLGMR